MGAVPMPDSDYFNADKARRAHSTFSSFPTHTRCSDALYAFEVALSLQKLCLDKLKALHKAADGADDFQAQDFIETEMSKQAGRIKELGNYVSELKRIGKGLGTFTFDERLDAPEAGGTDRSAAAELGVGLRSEQHLLDNVQPITAGGSASMRTVLSLATVPALAAIVSFTPSVATTPVGSTFTVTMVAAAADSCTRRRSMLGVAQPSVNSLTLSTTLPAGLEQVAAQIVGPDVAPSRRLSATGTCTVTTDAVTCTLPSLPAGGTATMTITATAATAGTKSFAGALTYSGYTGAAITKDTSLEVTATASFTVPTDSLPVGVYSIKCDYNPDTTNFVASNGPAFLDVISPNVTIDSVTPSVVSTPAGSTVAITVLVSCATYSPARRRSLASVSNGDGSAYNVVLTSALPLGLQLVSATVESSEPSPKRRLAAAGTCTTVGATANCTLLVVQAGGTASMVITATASGVGTQIVPAGLTFKAYKGAPITKSGSLQVTALPTTTQVSLSSSLLSVDGPNPTATVTVASSLPPVGTVTCTLVGQKAGSSPSTYGPLNLAVGPPGSPSTAKQAKFVLSLAGKPADDYNIQCAYAPGAVFLASQASSGLVLVLADMAIDSITPSVASSPVGSTLTFTVVATNTLPNLVRRRALLASTLGDAYNVVLTSTLPAGLKLLSATIAATGPIGRRRLAAPNSACTLAGRTATCTLGVVPAGGNATMVLQGKGLAAGSKQVVASLSYGGYTGQPQTAKTNVVITVRRPPPSTPVEDARGGADPYRRGNFVGFDDQRFLRTGTCDKWDTLIASPKQQFTLKTRWYTRPGLDKHDAVLMSAFELRSGATVVQVELVCPRRRHDVWSLKLRLNGRVIPAQHTTPTGLRASVTQARKGGSGKVVVDIGFARVAITQPWWRAQAMPADWLDVGIQLRSRLALPVNGILAPSYLRVVQAAPRAGAAAAAAAAAPTLSAGTGAGEA
ncbi:ferritin-chloroplastic-like [Micractinium conductrix]|uniref:Ferritin-chloroplastic-like n=1 Tax=Micractinium conductrix TaxID=554055 RepID=A0A2P6V206_9CHLO|nr:ferritin-chloroplastic-like [Micractinium conductrix]|eukprot:PSC68126.1 ferritin-chloroplastic-like [Micractinium conductrix]